MTLGIGALAVLGGVIGFFLNRDWDRMRPARQAAFDAVGTSLGGARFTEFAIGVLGVLFVTGEYGTGMIRSTLTAVPKRLPVLWAKLIVVGSVSLMLTEIASFAGYFIGQATLATHSVALSSDGALRAVIGTGLYLTVVALIGVELGFIIRSTAGGIAALVAILLVLPGVVSILPQSWQDTISPYLPSNAGAAIYDLRPEPEQAQAGLVRVRRVRPVAGRRRPGRGSGGAHTTRRLSGRRLCVRHRVGGPDRPGGGREPGRLRFPPGRVDIAGNGPAVAVREPRHRRTGAADGRGRARSTVSDLLTPLAALLAVGVLTGLRRRLVSGTAEPDASR